MKRIFFTCHRFFFSFSAGYVEKLNHGNRVRHTTRTNERATTFNADMEFIFPACRLANLGLIISIGIDS